MRVRSLLCAASAFLFSQAASAADKPGDHFLVLPKDIPAPFATPAVANSSVAIPRPSGAMPEVPPGFSVSVFASDLPKARWLALAPNGDVFVTLPGEGRIAVVHSVGGHAVVSTFAEGFSLPHGLAYHDGAIYVADLTAVWRLPYEDGGLRAKSRTKVTKAPSLGRSGGHFNRNLAFDAKGTMYVSVGSHGNLEEDTLPDASVQVVDAKGEMTTFASGLRNPISLVFYPGTDELFTTVNERDGLGDRLPPDYLTHVERGAFYGWPYAYTGNHPDPTFGAKRPDLVAKTKTPDLLFEAHSAPLGLAFYEGTQFPAEYKGDAFVSLHGSWNSGRPTGYKVVRVHFRGGRPQGGYENFLTGFWDGRSSPAQVWGRPVSLAVAKDGSLLISDDVGNCIWRVAYRGK
jgi:glucose/arabinose dehydrogenase